MMLTSTRKLAAAIGVSQSTVRNYLKDPRFPCQRTGPWTDGEAAAIKRWRNEFLQEDRAARATESSLGTQEKLASIELRIEHAAHMRARRMILEKRLVIRAELQREFGRGWEALQAALFQLPRALRQRIADEHDPARCEEIWKAAIETVYRNCAMGAMN